MTTISLAPVVNAWFNLPRGAAADGDQSIPFVTYCPLHGGALAEDIDEPTEP